MPETDHRSTRSRRAELGKENEYGREALEGLCTIGFKFEEPVG